MGDARRVRPGRCRIVARCATRCPASKHALADGVVSAAHVDAVANAAEGLDDAGRERLAGLADDLLGFARVEPVAVFERRCRLLGKRLAGDDGESELDTTESIGVGAALGRQTLRHAPHPPGVDPERDAKLWAAIDTQLATIKQGDGNSGTPIDAAAR